MEENQAANNVNDEVVLAESVQQNYFECFGDRDWDLYEEQDRIILKRIIGYAVFGPPTQLATSENETGYETEQNEEIDKFYKLFLNNNFTRDKNNICMRIIYICWNSTLEDNKIAVGRTPVFVLKKCQEEHKGEEYSSKVNCKVFIDVNGRVYDDWENYLNNNKLPKCTMVCPQNGQYNGTLIDDEPQVLLEYHESPACGVKSQILNAADIAGTTASVLTTIGAIGTMVVAAPALGVATAVGGAATAGYMVTRNIYTLADRGMHQQSINPIDNSESRWSWFGIATGAVGTAATAATGVVRTMAGQGKNISKSAQVALNVLNGANIVGSSTGILFCGYNLFDKYRNKETITALEIFQFSTSVLFFFRSVVDFQTAENLISKTQENKLNNYEKTLRSNRHRRVYRKALKETERLNGKIAGRAEVISGINNIGDRDAFFAGLVRINKDMNKAGARFEITADGNVRINSDHIVNPNEFASMNRGARANVLNNLPPIQVTITKTDFNNSQSVVTESLANLGKISTVGSIGLKASEFIIQIIDTQGNIESFAFLLVRLARNTVQKLFAILYKFLDEIQDSFEKFARTFPMANIAVGAMQFIIDYIKNIASDVQMQIDEFIDCLFNNDRTINREFLNNINYKFCEWLDERFNIFRSRSNTSQSGNTSQRTRKDCKKCKGHYFDD